jgi:hypothetical protein
MRGISSLTEELLASQKGRGLGSQYRFAGLLLVKVDCQERRRINSKRIKRLTL